MTTHILLVDDHPLFREGMRHVLERLNGPTRVSMAEDCVSAIAIALREPDLDLVLLDVQLAGDSGIDCLRRLRKDFPLLPVVILSASEDTALMRLSLHEGAQGYIPKSSTTQVMLNALQLVLVGGIYIPQQAVQESAAPEYHAEPPAHNPAPLTPRQLDVLKLLARGDSNKDIARQLQMSDGTVRIHVTAILRALGVSNRTQAGLAAARHGLLKPDT